MSDPTIVQQIIDRAQQATAAGQGHRVTALHDVAELWDRDAGQLRDALRDARDIAETSAEARSWSDEDIRGAGAILAAQARQARALSSDQVGAALRRLTAAGRYPDLGSLDAESGLRHVSDRGLAAYSTGLARHLSGIAHAEYLGQAPAAADLRALLAWVDAEIAVRAATAPPRRMTRDECADLAGITADTWSAYVSRGQAPGPVERVGRTPLWDAEQIEAWVASRPGRGARTDLRDLS